MCYPGSSSSLVYKDDIKHHVFISTYKIKQESFKDKPEENTIYLRKSNSMGQRTMEVEDA